MITSCLLVKVHKILGQTFQCRTWYANRHGIKGDLSFTTSLLTHHGCTTLVATTYDTLVQTLEKYPHAQTNITSLGDAEVPLLHGIDATKLSSYKAIRKLGLFDRIIFNFPHTGGKSTDVNRQVRYNQELLSEFFKSTVGLLKNEEASILVTLFEGQPYELWNIRDLARHSGLLVKRSFAFRAEAYPGYKHARTLGVVKKGGAYPHQHATQEEGSVDVSETAWKGELRAARTFEFGLKPEERSGETAGNEFATGSNFTPLPGRGAEKKKNKDSGSESD
jgi:25S rRNA (uracil2634-N3)-methyltransferase